MRSIQRRFEKFQSRDTDLSSFIHFGRAVIGQRFSKDAISRWFNKLVDRDDYERRDKRRLIHHFIDLTNLAEEHEKRGQIVAPSRDLSTN